MKTTRGKGLVLVNGLLVRTRQCKLCPWKKSTDPNAIPGGYCSNQHAGLKVTIAEPGVAASQLRLMACHESPARQEYPCVGWLNHQLGIGNNLELRWRLRGARFDLELDGDQHGRFEDTLPQ